MLTRTKQVKERNEEGHVRERERERARTRASERKRQRISSEGVMSLGNYSQGTTFPWIRNNKKTYFTWNNEEQVSRCL